jgi:hypothetical protein
MPSAHVHGVVSKNKRHTEARVGIFCLDPLSPVLTEEHVRRERTLGCLWIFFTRTATRDFLGFLGRLACLGSRKISIDGGNMKKSRRLEGSGGIVGLTFDLEASLGI